MMWVGSESTTSSAVTTPPASPTAVVSRPIAEASEMTATRMVIENPALGRRRTVTAFYCEGGRSGSEAHPTAFPHHFPPILDLSTWFDLQTTSLSP